MEFLKKEISKGNKQAELTKILFDAQKGINAIDSMSNPIFLAKDVFGTPGKGVYPKDLDVKEFHAILIKMLKDGKIYIMLILTQKSPWNGNINVRKGWFEIIEYCQR